MNKEHNENQPCKCNLYVCVSATDIWMHIYAHICRYTHAHMHTHACKLEHAHTVNKHMYSIALPVLYKYLFTANT